MYLTCDEIEWTILTGNTSSTIVPPHPYFERSVSGNNWLSGETHTVAELITHTKVYLKTVLHTSPFSNLIVSDWYNRSDRTGEPKMSSYTLVASWVAVVVQVTGSRPIKTFETDTSYSPNPCGDQHPIRMSLSQWFSQWTPALLYYTQAAWGGRLVQRIGCPRSNLKTRVRTHLVKPVGPV